MSHLDRIETNFRLSLISQKESNQRIQRLTLVIDGLVDQMGRTIEHMGRLTEQMCRLTHYLEHPKGEKSLLAGMTVEEWVPGLDKEAS